MSMTTSPPSLEFDALRVMRIRVALGESQAAFGARIGVHYNTVNRWECGKSQPTEARVRKALLEAEGVAMAQEA